MSRPNRWQTIFPNSGRTGQHEKRPPVSLRTRRCTRARSVAVFLVAAGRLRLLRLGSSEDSVTLSPVDLYLCPSWHICISWPPGESRSRLCESSSGESVGRGLGASPPWAPHVGAQESAESGNGVSRCQKGLGETLMQPIFFNCCKHFCLDEFAGLRKTV